ncbi:MAG: helical backbone metal receptor [Pseudomonadota bacterium]
MKRALLIALLAMTSACGRPDARSVAAPPGDAPRVVTLAPHLAELVASAGALDVLVGVSAYSDYPHAVTAIPVVSDGFRIDAEALLNVRPTLVLAWGGGGQASSRALLEALGVPVLEVPGRTLADIPQALRMIGAALDVADAAETAAQRFEADIDALGFSGEVLDVFYEINSQPLYTVGGGHFISELIELCGGANIFAELTTAAPAVSLEAVVLRDPQVILTTSNADAPEQTIWQRWPQLRAVQGNNVLSIPGDLVARPSVRLAKGGVAVCDALADARMRAALDQL